MLCFIIIIIIIVIIIIIFALKEILLVRSGSKVGSH